MRRPRPRAVTRVARLDHEGRPLSFRLPAWGLRLADGPRAARFLLPGSPSFGRAPSPWRYVEQMGAAHRLEADGLRLTVVTRRRGRLLTEVELLVERDPAG